MARGIFANFHFSPSFTPRMGLGDYLVTIRVLEHPWEPTYLLLDPCGQGHGPLTPSILLFVRVSVAPDVHTSSLPPSTAQKWKIFRFFCDILTIHNNQISYVKHVLDALYVFHPIWVFGGGWGGAAQKWKCRTRFFDILTIHNDQISHVKHVLDPLDVFSPLFACRGGKEPSNGLGHNLLMQFSTLYSSKKWKFSKPNFLIF